MALVLYCILTVFVIVSMRWYFRRYKVIQYLSKYPGPPPLPIVGNALDFFPREEQLPLLLKYADTYGPIVKLWLGPTPSMLVIKDLKFLEFLLNCKNCSKSVEYKFLEPWCGEGLLTNDGGARWAKYRKILTPAFHYNILKNFIPIFSSVCDVLIQKLHKEVGNPSYDICNIMKAYSLDNICECAMGASVNALNDSTSEFLEDVSTICNVLIERTFNPLLKPDILYKMTKLYLKVQASFKKVNDMTEQVIIQRKLEMPKVTEAKGLENDADAYSKKRKLAFLDLLLDAAAKDPSVTDQCIREEVSTFLFAGHDTTQAALAYSLYCLANDKDVQEKAVHELQEIFGNDKKRSITIEDIHKMRYIEAVIKETNRLYPPVPLIGRTVKNDVEYNGTIIPKETTLILFAYGLHRDPNLYSDPLVFNPERFISGGEPKNAYGYLAFSGGPRDCIGKKFAMIEIKLTLAMLLREFELLPANPHHELQLVTEVVLKSLNGVRIQLQKRNF